MMKTLPNPSDVHELAKRELLTWAAKHALLAIEAGAPDVAANYLRVAVRESARGIITGGAAPQVGDLDAWLNGARNMGPMANAQQRRPD